MVEAASAHVKRAAVPSGPLLPAARAGALSMMQDDDVRMDDLAMLIRADPGLTLVLLRAANSAASASRRRIEDTRDALVRIGLQATKRVVAAAVVGEAFQNMDDCGIDEDAFWAHSLATAVICESSVTTSRLRPVAFSAGLLHDVGRLVLGASMPDVYGSLSEKARTEVMVLGAEAAIFGEDHAKAGGRLLSVWGVSDEIAAAVGRHHEPPSGELEEALALARRVVRRLGYDDGLTCHLDAPAAPPPAAVPVDIEASAPHEATPSRPEPVEVDARPYLKPDAAKALREKVSWYQGAMRGNVARPSLDRSA
jgi:HD-like signal output (HDOD) protein